VILRLHLLLEDDLRMTLVQKISGARIQAEHGDVLKMIVKFIAGKRKALQKQELLALAR
jgi:hypothetical protein